MDVTPSLHIQRLSPPSLPDEDGRELFRQRMQLLEGVEDILKPVVGMEGRLWLCSALSQLTCVPISVQLAVFLDLIRDATPPSSVSSQYYRQGAEC
jgi:hypothetical protein